MGRKKQKWEIGDVFLVRTADEQHVVAQIVGREPEVLNSVSVAFFNVRVSNAEDVKSAEFNPESIFSVVFATRDRLDSGAWKVVANRPVFVHQSMLPHEDKRSIRFVGAKVFGSGILNEFLNAFYGLMPWDDWNEPDYLDRLLLNPSKKPKNLVFKSDQSR